MNSEKRWMLWVWISILIVTIPITLILSPLLIILFLWPVKINGEYYLGIETLFTNHRSNGTPKGYTAFQWWLRNPMHDWTSYVIGIEGKKFTNIPIVGPEKVTLM